MFMMADRAEIWGLYPQPAQAWKPLVGACRRGAGASSAYKLSGEFGWQRDWVLQRDEAPWGAWKRLCGHFWYPMASPHPKHGITITCLWLSSTKPVLGVKHRALQAEARAQLAPVKPAVPKALRA